MEHIQIKEHNVLNEKLLKAEKYSKTFKCQILSKRKSLVICNMNIDYEARTMFLSTQADINIEIKFSDILAFFPLKDSDEEEIRMTMIKVNPEQIVQISSVNAEKSKTSSQVDCHEFLSTRNSAFAHLNFYPLFTVRKCNCCGWICCKCRETITERRAKVSIIYDRVYLIYLNKSKLINLHRI